MGYISDVLVLVGSKVNITDQYLDDLIEFVNSCISRKHFRSVYLIDDAYAKIQVTDLNDNVTVAKDYPTRVFSHQMRRPINDAYSAHQSPMYYSSYHAELEFLRTYEGSVMYVSMNPNFGTTMFELAAVVCVSVIDNKTFFVLNEDEPLDTILKTKRAFEIPNLFRGSETTLSMKIRLDKYAKKDYKNFVLQCIATLRALLGSDYQYLENNKPCPGWALQTSGVVGALFIGTYQVIPGAYDKTHQQEINDSASFRLMFTKILVVSLANYFVHIPLVSMTSDRNGEDTLVTKEDLEWAYKTETTKAKGLPKAVKTSRLEVMENDKNLIAWSCRELWDRIYSRYQKIDEI